MKNTSDFDSALESRSLAEIASMGDLLWAIRVGGTSQYESGIGVHATNVGVNAEDGNSGQRSHRVWIGELIGTYQATYIAHFRGTPLPTVICVFRDVTPDGRNSYEVQARGRGPIGTCMLYIALGSAGARVFLKSANVVAKRTKRGTVTS